MLGMKDNVAEEHGLLPAMPLPVGWRTIPEGTINGSFAYERRGGLLVLLSASIEIIVPRLASLSVDGLEALGDALARARVFVTETTAESEPVSFALMSIADWQRLVDRADHGWELAC